MGDGDINIQQTPGRLVLYREGLVHGMHDLTPKGTGALWLKLRVPDVLWSQVNSHEPLLSAPPSLAIEVSDECYALYAELVALSVSLRDRDSDGSKRSQLQYSVKQHTIDALVFDVLIPGHSIFKNVIGHFGVDSIITIANNFKHRSSFGSARKWMSVNLLFERLIRMWRQTQRRKIILSTAFM